MAINKAIISGNLVRDPEKRGSAETPVLSFSVAVNERVKKGDEWVDSPNFVDCVLFGARAKSLASILAKGMKVAIDGKLRQSTWENESGKHSKLEVIVGEIEFFAPKKEEQDGKAW